MAYLWFDIPFWNKLRNELTSKIEGEWDRAKKRLMKTSIRQFCINIWIVYFRIFWEFSHGSQANCSIFSSIHCFCPVLFCLLQIFLFFLFETEIGFPVWSEYKYGCGRGIFEKCGNMCVLMSYNIRMRACDFKNNKD